MKEILYAAEDYFADDFSCETSGIINRVQGRKNNSQI